MSAHESWVTLASYSAVAALMAIVAAILAGPSHAEAGHPCATISDSTQRLACYDRAFGRNGGQTATAANGAASTIATAPTVTNPVADFGLTPAQQQARDPERVKDAGPSNIAASITSLNMRRDGLVVIELDNGQVWMQNDPAVRANLRVGDGVQIRKGSLGSHVLQADRRQAIRVRRVK